MAQITEEFARRMIDAYQNGGHIALTSWEKCQLACAWLRANGLKAPDWVDIPTPMIPAPASAQETPPARMQELNARFAGRERNDTSGELTPRLGEETSPECQHKWEPTFGGGIIETDTCAKCGAVRDQV